MHRMRMRMKYKRIKKPPTIPTLKNLKSSSSTNLRPEKKTRRILRGLGDAYVSVMFSLAGNLSPVNQGDRSGDLRSFCFLLVVLIP
ncbi:hypothetical protein Leryth_002990 [Lithospermum erythrorhizon]|nr:hypothetical protein Leryth_002990 [Lithospermum erythrorhizon]